MQVDINNLEISDLKGQIKSSDDACKRDQLVIMLMSM